jgi:parvulin-like peptidyl-prolyl isomerase
MAALSISVWAQPPADPAPSSPLQIRPPAPVEKVVATVGDEKITNTEIDSMIRGQLRGRPVPPEVMTNFRKAALESMIQSRLITQFVAAKNIKVEPAEVEETIADITKQLAERGATISMLLQAQGLTEETLRKRIAVEMAVEKYVKAEVTDKQAEEYFNAHKQEFLEEPKVRASHILLPYEPQSTAEEKKAANDKIAAIRQEIVGGADFAEAAKKYSSCPSKEQGGDLDFFARDQMVKPFADAAFGMKPGEISQPVETEFGVHLIKLTDVKSGEVTFAEAADAVKDTLYQQLLEKAAEEQRKITKVEIIE